MPRWKSLRNLALIGALFAATHIEANQSHEVVSSNGTTNIVERIDFPVGDIKDIVPAGDKYIIHANPIDSLRDSVAVDALFVMEKAKNESAFGRTFSDEITSVAYVPSLDMAVWSYKTQRSADLMELKQGQSALHAASSTTNYIANTAGQVSNDVMLFSSPSNTVYEIGNFIYGHGFRLQNNEYTEYIALRSGSLGKNHKLAMANAQGVFTLEPSLGRVRYITFSKGSRSSYVFETENATSIAAISDGNNIDDGDLIVGDTTGTIRSYPYVINSCSEVPNGTNQVFNTCINDMALTPNNTVQIVSTKNNTVAEVDANLNVLDRVIPNTQEAGYRKVIADGDNTLLLSNTHSNFFYRIKKVR